MDAIVGHINRANRLFDLNRYQEAISEVKKALAIDATNAEALGLLVNATAFGKTPEDTEKTGILALQHHPQDDYIYFGLGVARMRMGYADQAEEYFSGAIKFQQFQPAYHANLAIAYKEQGKWEKAQESIDRALELHPTYDFAHNINAQIQQKTNPKTAQRSYDEALRLSPDHNFHHREKAALCFKEKDYVQAAFHYQQAVRLDPTDIPVRSEMLRTLVRTHPTYSYFTRFFPGADGSNWTQLFVLTFISILVLMIRYIFGFSGMSVLLSLPFVILAGLFCLGEPYARHKLSDKYFRQKSYATANPYLPMQTLCQLCVTALFLSLFTEMQEIKILVVSSLVTAYICALFNREKYGEFAEIHYEKPWLMTAVWTGFALLVPVMLYLGKEDVITEGMI